MLECGTQCSVESVFSSSEESRVGAYALSRVANRPRVRGMRMDIKRSLMPTGGSVNDGSREARTAKSTPWMRGEPKGLPFKWKRKPLPLLLEILQQRDGFHWVQLCRCCSAGAQQQPKLYAAVVSYYLRCWEEYIHSMQQRKVFFFVFCIFIYFFHVSTPEWDCPTNVAIVVNVWLHCPCHVVAPAILQCLIVPLCSSRGCCVVLAVS